MTTRLGERIQLVGDDIFVTNPKIIADAIGRGSGELKTGAPARGERVAKYNRLIEIAAGYPGLPYGIPAP